MRIISLQGKADSGKTTTIKMLETIMLQNNYTAIPGKREGRGKDFLDIFLDSNRKKVGVTSSGDTYDLVTDKLQTLVSEKCDVCICACRTFDRKPPGTVAATKQFPKYTNEYVKKTVSPTKAQQPIDNSKDANILFSKI